jgi:small subunit ribosomal protein S1
VRNFKKGDTVEAVVLAVDPERERISLGIKQLEQDPFGQYMAAQSQGQHAGGTVVKWTRKGAVIDLADGIEGYMRAATSPRSASRMRRQFLKVGDKIEAKFIGMDRKGRMVQLSIRAKDEAELREVMDEYSSASGGTTKLGALLREQLSGKSE